MKRDSLFYQNNALGFTFSVNIPKVLYILICTDLLSACVMSAFGLSTSKLTGPFLLFWQLSLAQRKQTLFPFRLTLYSIYLVNLCHWDANAILQRSGLFLLKVHFSGLCWAALLIVHKISGVVVAGDDY